MATGSGQSAAGLAYLSLDDAQLLRQCSVDTFRSSGPGGQKRNKTSSGVRLRHHPTGASVTATEDRSQHVNEARALRRLREAIALEIRGIIDRDKYRPSALFASFVSPDGRLIVGRRDAQYTLVVSELLDLLAACGLRISDAAKGMGVSTGHLVGFVERDPKLWRHVNQMRSQAGLKPLR